MESSSGSGKGWMSDLSTGFIVTFKISINSDLSCKLADDYDRSCPIGVANFLYYSIILQMIKFCTNNWFNGANATTVVEGERDRAENGPKLSNSEILKNLGTKLNHLTKEFKQVFSDVPKCTTCVCHDVKVGEANPIKQRPYRINPIKLEQMRKKIDYMLKYNIIESSDSS